MPATTSSTYEWDAQEGRPYGQNSLLRLNSSEYYVIVQAGDSGTDYDGFLRSIKVFDNNGTISKSVVNSYEFDTSDGYAANIVQIPGTNKYVIAYDDVGGAKVTLVTYYIYAENGTIGRPAIDTQTCTYQGWANSGYTGHLDLLKVYDNVYAVMYPDTSTVDGFMETWWIGDDGVINNTQLDIEEFDTVYGVSPSSCVVDTNTIALAYLSAASTGNYVLMTYNISTAGLITDTPADSWTFEANPYLGSCVSLDIVKIGNTYYDICYVDSSYDLYTKSVVISSTGDITAAWVDSLLVNSSTLAGMNAPKLFFVDNPNVAVSGNGVMGVTFINDSTNFRGYIYTFNVSSSGVIGAATIDNLMWTSTDALMAHMVYVNKNSYLVIWCGGSSDGWSATVNITTNYASSVISNPIPTNATTGVSLSPTCNITINDADGSPMKLDWFENSTGSWVHRQQNASCVNGTYRWVFAQVSSYVTRYWWKVYVNDTVHNVTAWYTFQTRSEPWATNMTLSGFSPTYNTTWSKNTTGLGSSNYWTSINSSSFAPYNRNETVVINLTVNSTSWVKNITFGGTFMNDSVNGSVIDCDNITVLVSTDNVTWGILQDNAGSGMGRFPKNTGYLVWNHSTSPGGIDPFMYGGGTFHIKSNTTVYMRMMINLTPGVLNGTYDQDYFFMVAIYNDTEVSAYPYVYFTSRLVLWNYTAPAPSSPIDITIVCVYPANTSTGVIRNVTLRVSVTQANGSLMTITFYRDNGSVYLGSFLNVGNGTYIVVSYATAASHVYNWSVNITDGVAWNNSSQWFETGLMFGGGVSSGGYVQKRITTYLTLGLVVGILFGGLFFNFKKRRKT